MKNITYDVIVIARTEDNENISLLADILKRDTSTIKAMIVDSKLLVKKSVDIGIGFRYLEKLSALAIDCNLEPHGYNASTSNSVSTHSHETHDTPTSTPASHQQSHNDGSKNQDTEASIINPRSMSLLIFFSFILILFFLFISAVIQESTNSVVVTEGTDNNSTNDSINRE